MGEKGFELIVGRFMYADGVKQSWLQWQQRAVEECGPWLIVRKKA